MRIIVRRTVAAGVIVAFACCCAAGDQSLTIDRAVEQALAGCPAVRVSLEQVSAAAARIGPLEPGNEVVKRATDEIRDGARVNVRQAAH